MRPWLHLTDQIADDTTSSMSNLQRTASQFFINFLIIFTLTMTMYSFFRSIGALSGSLDAGINLLTHCVKRFAHIMV